MNGGAYGLGRGGGGDVVSEGSLVSLRVQMRMRLLTIGYDLKDRTMGEKELLSLVEEGNRCESPELEGPLQEKRGTEGG